MRIGIDARELTGHATGVGRYLAGLLRQWLTPESAHEFVLFAHRPLDAPELRSANASHQIIDGTGGTWWEQQQLRGAMARARLDAFFAPGYTAPLWSGVPTVVAIHDVSFAAHPEWFSAREGLRRRLLTRRSAHAARAVVTISAFSRDEIARHLDVTAAKVHVIPPGIDAPLDAATEASRTPGTDRAPGVLFVGSIFNRRNVPDLIDAILRLRQQRPDVSLDLVGDNRTHPLINVPQLVAGASGAVRWHRYVKEEELRRLYACARAFAFLSEYEGLGLTPLEALSVGVPPILLDTAVARESCGDAALYVSPHDIAATASALDTLLFDALARRRILDAAPAVLARYQWDDAARQTLSVIEQLR